MKHLLVGNGINIYFDNNYSARNIVYRLLNNCERKDFPLCIIDDPSALRNYIEMLYRELKRIISGRYDRFTNCEAERVALGALKERYGDSIETLEVVDIGFEDYYLIHDLFCHKVKMTNPTMFDIRQAMRMAYLYSIYNDGEINKLHTLYPKNFVTYLSEFDAIFTTNYDSNIDLETKTPVFHIHGQFDKLPAKYDSSSFLSQLPNALINNQIIDYNYLYLYSNALSSHCGEYKKLVLEQALLANSALEKLVKTYNTDKRIKTDIDSWCHDSDPLVTSMGYAVKLKISHPELNLYDDYHFDELSKINGELAILGLSPWNDTHIFETINLLNLDNCTFYYFSKNECERIKVCLPELERVGALQFKDVMEFWKQMCRN